MDVLAFTFQRIRDGRNSHSLYNTHQLMVRRCYSEKSNNYKDYGGKGVQVCESWLGPYGFWRFVEDMGERPHGTTLDRIDPFGNYEPSNCRWADKKIQANNTRLENATNTSGAAGVHWCNRDLMYIVQISLNGSRTCIGRFNSDQLEDAEAFYLEVKNKKLSGISDDSIYKEFVTDKRPTGSKGMLRRKKTSKYWGVSYKAKNNKWVASTERYLGIRDTEEAAYQLVLDWLKEKEAKEIGSTLGPDNLGYSME